MLENDDDKQGSIRSKRKADALLESIFFRIMEDAVLLVRTADGAKGARQCPSCLPAVKKAAVYCIAALAAAIARSRRMPVSLEQIGSCCGVELELRAIAAIDEALSLALDGSAVSASDLSCAQLGILYEQLLSYQETPAHSQKAPERIDKAKKRSGSFYTPDSLSELVCERAFAALDTTDIASLRVLDPSMGGGALLLAAMRKLSHLLMNRYEHIGTPLDWNHALKLIATNCLYGVDKDAGAVAVSRLAILLETNPQSHSAAHEICSALTARLKCGNALIGAWGESWREYPDGAVRERRRCTEYDTGRRPAACDAKREIGAAEKEARDRWCAMFFLPADLLPSKQRFDNGGASLLRETDKIAHERQFFHWQVEFPEIFRRSNGGFDIVIGNPPWEIEKPNSREFFGALDATYWKTGKQEALIKQESLFNRFPGAEQSWMELQAQHQDLRNWVKFSHSTLFQNQGRSDLNAYKLFLELGHALLRNGGRLSFVVPAGIYCDLGASELRSLFLHHCRWLSVDGFENRGGLFDIHRSFKFCVIAVAKGGMTETIDSSFMRSAPAVESNRIQYGAECIRRLDPDSLTLLEISHETDLRILEALQSRCTNLKDSAIVRGFEREFDMTNDSSRFVGRDRLEEQGYVPSRYGQWLLGDWQTGRADRADWIESADGMRRIAINSCRDIALPLYEGRMVGQFDFSEKQWHSGRGRTAQWNRQSGPGKTIGPQFLVPVTEYSDWFDDEPLKCGFLAVGSATNTRSMIATALDTMPCGNSVAILRTESDADTLLLVAVLNSFIFDFSLRSRLTGNNLNYFIVGRCPLPDLSPGDCRERVAILSAALCLNDLRFARHWIGLLSRTGARQALWLTKRDAWFEAALNALVASFYEIEFEDLQWILADAPGREKTNAKGFFRVDKDLPPPLRRTHLTLGLYRELCREGRSKFLDRVDQALAERATVTELAALRTHADRIDALKSFGRDLIQGREPRGGSPVTINISMTF